MISCIATRSLAKVVLHRGIFFFPTLLLPRYVSVDASSVNFAGKQADLAISPVSDPKLLTIVKNTPAVRNKKLADIIREGVVILNQTSTYIQNNVQTTKSVFSSPDEESKPNAKQLAEEHRIFTTAQNCLEEICRRDPSFPLMAGGEPIMLLGVQVKQSFSHADIYWSLPYVVLSSPELNEKQREFLKGKMEERVQGAPGRMLIRSINAVLSSYYPPKIRFKEAPPLLVYQVMQDLEG